MNPTQFALDAQTLVRRAADLALENRARFIDLPSTTDFLTSHKPRPGYFWDNHHAGIAAGLTGDTYGDASTRSWPRTPSRLGRSELRSPRGNCTPWQRTPKLPCSVRITQVASRPS
ncbi:hypothetical protein [Streptomyces mirabilis]|uniref:hypothetical protein n=1 Tax=Streptomyces mirabilis TaxID=68239 RepID=UPI003669D293